MLDIKIKTHFEDDGVYVGFNQEQGKESFILNSYFSFINLIQEHKDFFKNTLYKMSYSFGFDKEEYDVRNLLAKSVINRFIYLNLDSNLDVTSFLMPIGSNVEVSLSNILVDELGNIDLLDDSKIDINLGNIGEKDASEALFAVIFNNFSTYISEKVAYKLSTLILDDKKELSYSLIIDCINKVFEEENKFVAYNNYELSNFLYFAFLNLFNLSYSDFELTEQEKDILSGED